MRRIDDRRGSTHRASEASGAQPERAARLDKTLQWQARVSE
jgi:hypothetical protein